MQLTVSTYIPGTSPLHRLDARVKIVLLAAYSVALFFVDTWTGMAAAACVFLGALAVSGVAPGRVFKLVVPVYVLAAFTVVFNMFVFASPDALAAAGASGVGTAGGGGLYPIAGTFCLTLPGLQRGCFFALRILLLVFASILVSYVTSSTELTRAFGQFLRPLSALHVPVDDVATVLSIALRFIPVTAEEFCRVHDAQWARGSKFGEGSVVDRLKAWTTVLIPLFVRLFRRADVLAQAMDARCYGASARRTALHASRMRAGDAVALVCGVALCVALGVLL